MTMDTTPRAASLDSRDWLALAALLVLTAGIYLWNDYTLPGLIGYDSKGHALYMKVILDEGRLPNPLEGWSTFHPPTYYLIGAAIWSQVGLDDIHRLMLALRSVSSAAILLCGAIAFILVRKRSGQLGLALLTAGLVLYLPMALMAASMVGNEALATGFASIGVAAILRLQADPRDLRWAAVAGTAVGFALATKFTGLFVASGLAVPFLRRDVDSALVRSAAVGLICVLAIAAPVYVRNIAVTGTPIPMTRDLEPQKSAEEAFVLRERVVTDYLRFDPAVFLRPSIYHIGAEAPTKQSRNPIMTSVWGLAYSATWWDAFGHRIPSYYHRDGYYQGPLLLFLGVLPTLTVLLGLGVCVADLFRRGLGSTTAPLLAMTATALAAFLGFTWRAPATVAVKGSYGLPLLVPAALYFTSGLAALPTWARRTVIVVSAAAVVASAAIFTNGVVFPFIWRD